MSSKFHFALLGLLGSISAVQAETLPVEILPPPPPSEFPMIADDIRNTYESQLYTLETYEEGHYALRLYRQTLDNKYLPAIWSDMARVADRLNYIAEQVNTPEQIYLYSQKQLSVLAANKQDQAIRRYAATKHKPEYLYLAVDLLAFMERADEYGLAHKDDAKLREILHRYDFSKYALDPEMIKAWAAQLANQVLWLKQLGEQDLSAQFIAKFRKLYPDNADKILTVQQYENKLYGMTHLIFASSHYYQFAVDETEYSWIFDYFRKNIDTILLRAKPDVIAEIGISFLLAGLDNDPVVEKTRIAIDRAVNREHKMIPATDGNFDLNYGEHRNVLAIMLLDWQGVHALPIAADTPSLSNPLPYGLVPKPTVITAPKS
jgi:hypothetical protein